MLKPVLTRTAGPELPRGMALAEAVEARRAKMELRLLRLEHREAVRQLEADTVSLNANVGALGSSIVCSSLASTVLFDFELNAAFAAGIAAVIYSVFLYGQRAHCCGALTPPEN